MKRIVNVLFAGVLAMTVLSCSEEKKGYTLKRSYSMLLQNSPSKRKMFLGRV